MLLMVNHKTELQQCYEIYGIHNLNFKQNINLLSISNNTFLFITLISLIIKVMQSKKLLHRKETKIYYLKHYVSSDFF